MIYMSFTTVFPDVTYRNLSVSGTTNLASNIDMLTSTSTVGKITKVGNRFITNPLADNTFVGVNSGSLSIVGHNNTAVGYTSQSTGTAGQFNTSEGVNTLVANNANACVAVGYRSLELNNIGNTNTAVGATTLPSLTGNNSSNTAIGVSAGYNMLSGNGNTFLGSGAGSSLLNGNNNLYINNNGAANESNTIRIGASNAACFVDGIANVSVADNSKALLINANGQIVSDVTSPGIVNIAPHSPNVKVSAQGPAVFNMDVGASNVVNLNVGEIGAIASVNIGKNNVANSSTLTVDGGSAVTVNVGMNAPSNSVNVYANLPLQAPAGLYNVIFDYVTKKLYVSNVVNV